MPHAVWKGAISFGLVTIPVTLYPAEARRDLTFRLLDRRDLSPVKQKRVNERTGAEVLWEDVVKGYELEEGRFVVVTDEDFRAADVKATQTIDVISAVCADEIDPAYFDKPYHLEPARPGRKAYALLRETLRQTDRVALAKIVIRTRQHLAALVPRGPLLMLELMRYPHELHAADALDLPAEGVADAGLSHDELAIAAQLVETISRPFDPAAEEYRDTYRDALLALIDRKAAGGEVATPAPARETDAYAGAEVVDIASLLRASLEAARARGA
ncbi:MAG TPA: Ku protein [Coriobacteriia bacterium]|nr:Ku protein [Coriobacteriia bacterium]